jgi:hypothetical protein
MAGPLESLAITLTIYRTTPERFTYSDSRTESYSEHEKISTIGILNQLDGSSLPGANSDSDGA